MSILQQFDFHFCVHRDFVSCCRIDRDFVSEDSESGLVAGRDCVVRGDHSHSDAAAATAESVILCWWSERGDVVGFELDRL